MHGRKNNMIEVNSNIINISLLKCVLDELDRELPYTRKQSNIHDVKEVIKEVIQSLQNKG